MKCNMHYSNEEQKSITIGKIKTEQKSYSIKIY